jgi:hypothetical protein
MGPNIEGKFDVPSDDPCGRSICGGAAPCIDWCRVSMLVTDSVSGAEAQVSMTPIPADVDLGFLISTPASLALMTMLGHTLTPRGR